jgi:hypothetical protein
MLHAIIPFSSFEVCSDVVYMLAFVKIRSVNNSSSASWHMPILNALVDQKERSSIHGHKKTKNGQTFTEALLTNRYEMVSILLFVFHLHEWYV